MYALRGKKPSEEVTVKVMRDGMPLTVKCTLSRREYVFEPADYLIAT